MLNSKEIFAIKTLIDTKPIIIDLGGIITTTEYYTILTSLANRGFISFITGAPSLKGRWVLFRNNK